MTRSRTFYVDPAIRLAAQRDADVEADAIDARRAAPAAHTCQDTTGDRTPAASRAAGCARCAQLRAAR